MPCRRLVPPALLTLAVVFAGSACTPAQDEASQEGTSAASSAVVPPTPAEGALPEFDRLTLAQERLRDAGTAVYSVTATSGDGDVVARGVGAYDLSAPGGFFHSAVADRRPEQVTAIYAGPDEWHRAGPPDQALEGCWTHRRVDGNQVSVMFVGPIPRVLLTHVNVANQLETQIVAMVDTEAVAAVMPDVIVERIGLPAGVPSETPVEYLFDGDDLFGFDVSLDALLHATQKAGGTPDPSLAALDLQVRVVLDKALESVELQPPDPGQQVELGPGETPAEGMKRCGTV